LIVTSGGIPFPAQSDRESELRLSPGGCPSGT